MKKKLFIVAYVIDIVYLISLSVMIFMVLIDIIHYLACGEFFILPSLNTARCQTLDESWEYVKKLEGWFVGTALPIYKNQLFFCQMSHILKFGILIPIILRTTELVMSRRILVVFFVLLGIIVLLNVALRLFISGSVSEFYILRSLGIIPHATCLYP